MFFCLLGLSCAMGSLTGPCWCCLGVQRFPQLGPLSNAQPAGVGESEESGGVASQLLPVALVFSVDERNLQPCLEGDIFYQKLSCLSNSAVLSPNGYLRVFLFVPGRNKPTWALSLMRWGLGNT